MSVFSRFFGLLVLCGLTIPLFLNAQEKADDKQPAVKKDADKKDVPKEDKKDVEKKDDKKEDKKDEKKEEKKEEKKDEKKEEKKEEKKDPKDDEKPEPKKKDKGKGEPEEKVVYGQVIPTRIKRMEANSNREFTIEVPAVDPNKVANLQQWQAEQMFQIAQTNLKDRAQRVFRYQMELARKQNDIYSPKEVNFRIAEQAKIRSLYPPVEYDDKGFYKKWTTKELLALKGSGKLPGYPSSIENLRAGQMVQLYLAKPAPNLKHKKKIDEDIELQDRIEVVMILITMEAAPNK